ncbi:hypothetical protein [Klebsiella sp. Shm-1]|uniref:hypothetical protein n=1 Tax=Klebsiella sp. Shm-1 TaxID=3233339 RepID=UPI0034650101
MADNISMEAEATNALTAQQSDIDCDFAADVLLEHYGIRVKSANCVVKEIKTFWLKARMALSSRLNLPIQVKNGW